MTRAQTSQALGRMMPYLRRYARAVVGDQERGDRDVAAALGRLAQAAPALSGEALRVALYRSLHEVWEERRPPVVEIDADRGEGLSEGATVLEHRLLELDTPHRQALLLATLEGFGSGAIATILGRRPAEIDGLFAEAKAELRRQPPSRVLVVEDEPVIALDIATSLEANGHTVVGIATTHREAVAISRAESPDLILADIRLADESSGLDAVREILRETLLPVVFVTAYPERLLTGARPEPTFLVTKPFDAETLHVTISQALASGRRRRRSEATA